MEEHALIRGDGAVIFPVKSLAGGPTQWTPVADLGLPSEGRKYSDAASRYAGPFLDAILEVSAACYEAYTFSSRRTYMCNLPNNPG